MNHLNVKMSNKLKKSKGILYTTEQSDEIYKWIEDNDIEYYVLNNIIGKSIYTTENVIREYNKQANNKDNMTKEIFDYIIYLINTNQNTYYGIGPYIKINNIWNILTKDIYYKKHFTTMNNASTQTNQ